MSLRRITEHWREPSVRGSGAQILHPGHGLCTCRLWQPRCDVTGRSDIPTHNVLSINRGPSCPQRAASPCPVPLPRKLLHAQHFVCTTPRAYTAMKNNSIKAEALGTQYSTFGCNHGQDGRRMYPTVSQQPDLDGDSSDDEFPAIDSEKFKKVHRRWCESECILYRIATSTP